ncbi:unnamed protein product [Acanthoscelides obtectus]|uniref:WAP domain-containing protein n=1 Tax=Acanthoscelides obtectus TaxID=200917 RepID=A0A9P0K8N7_ACAOB|nr:unnamed protein product [Acanthoscelides obtectus]CAK1683111.1 hypothetical protein AOBTE_LOCUS34088 [Acanthoscelides obtectus]
MSKSWFLVICLFAVFVTIAAISSDVGCPPSSSMLSCSPKCKEDSECQGRKCCPNICNMKSCVPANHKSNSNDGYKGSSQKTATGTYCGNVKCGPYEKCELDRTTKRQKCVRS